jgi:choline-glycine betaine transporter
MKYVLIYTLFLMTVFYNSCGQSQTNVLKDNIKSETKDSIITNITSTISSPSLAEFQTFIIANVLLEFSAGHKQKTGPISIGPSIQVPR